MRNNTKNSRSKLPTGANNLNFVSRAFVFVPQEFGKRHHALS